MPKACPNHYTTIALLAMLTVVAQANGQGITVHGVGPVNRAVGGAGTAAPLDAIGSVHWNPGSITALHGSEVTFGMELLLADVTLRSTIGGATTSVSGEAGIAPIPAVGWVHHIADTSMSLGLGLYGIAGFRNNLPRDPNNPILANGPMFADAEFMQMAPTFAWRCSDQLSIGIAPTLTLAKLTLNPLGPSMVTPAAMPGSGNRVHWGGGVQAGVFYAITPELTWGVTVKSPQYFEEFRFFTSAGVVKCDIDYPMIISMGWGYTGWDRWTMAWDVRYHDFKNTDGFDALGWSNVFATAIGAQYQWNELWKLRGGYNFNQNPIHSADVLTNIATPLIQQHNVSCGAACTLAWGVEMSVAYVYLVENDVAGPLPAGVFGPNASLRHEISAHSALLGITVKY